MISWLISSASAAEAPIPLIATYDALDDEIEALDEGSTRTLARYRRATVTSFVGAGMVPLGWMTLALGATADSLELMIPGYAVFVTGTGMLSAGTLVATYTLRSSKRTYPPHSVWAGWLGAATQLTALFGIWMPVGYAFSIGQLAYNQNHGGKDLFASGVLYDADQKLMTVAFRF